MPKLKPISFEPELNQRPKDSPTYHLQSSASTNWADRRIGVHQNNKKFRTPTACTSGGVFWAGHQALRFVGNAIRASTQERTHLSFFDLVAHRF